MAAPRHQNNWLDPVTTIPALGSLISFADQKYFLAPAKVTQIQQLAAEFLPCRRVFVRKLSKLAGLIISRTHCLGPAARIQTRSMYTNLEERLQPHERLFLSMAFLDGIVPSTYALILAQNLNFG